MSLLKADDFLREFSLDELISKSDREGVKYMGFDARKIVETLISKRITKKDLGLAVYIFLTRGNNINNIIKTTNASHKAEIENLQTKLGIVSDIKGKRPEAINLARIAAVSPHATVVILKESDASELRPITNSELRLIINNYPKWLCTINFCSCIPQKSDFERDEDCDLILRCFLFYSILESKRLSKISSPKEAKSVCYRYIMASYNSSYLSTGERKVFTKKFLKELIIEGETGFVVTDLAVEIDDCLSGMLSANKFVI